jgi:hypothetical protein
MADFVALAVHDQNLKSCILFVSTVLIMSVKQMEMDVYHILLDQEGDRQNGWDV